MKSFFKAFCLALISFLVVSCNNTYVENVDRGEGYYFRPGYPELRMVASGLFDIENQAIIEVVGDIVYGSVVFKKVNNRFQASLSVDIQIIDKENPESTPQNLQFPIVIRDSQPNIVQSQRVFSFNRNIQSSPGRYTVNVTLIDNSSGKQTSRSADVIIPDPDDITPHITNIRVLGKELEEERTGFFPVTTYDVQKSVDSLRLEFQVTNNDPDNPLTIESRLLRFRSDTSIANPLTYYNYPTASLPYKGIDYDRFEVIQESRRTLLQPGSVLIQFWFTDLERGNYRFEVTSRLDEDRELFKARDFGIKSPNYPAIRSARELAAPLHYLMDDDDHEKLMSISDNDSLKKEIDRFWLSNVKSASKAKQVLELYYQRVEEANKQFSNFKEGWKTDPGMIYILFGPPLQVETSLDRMRWSYSYNMSRFEDNFFFETPRVRSEFYPYYNYLLNRSQQYYNVQYQQIQRWLNGTVLRDNL
ncbi:GWxTD domain-containing protein [Balneola sp. MJW-20]|uniref:GWxTD domain-containing protein n=1 Tax=Gracilimonas aurantiaca TaxID=3234185 RepID=UPI003465EF81